MIAYNIFEKWGIDAIGPMPMTARGNCYLLTAVDYLSRWAEARPVKAVNAKTVCKFVSLSTRIFVAVLVYPWNLSLRPRAWFSE